MGMMFWYGVEQLFMDHILRDPSARAWTAFVFTATWLVFDIPGGIIADKFGRRRTLIVSASFQTAGVCVLALSSTLPMYLVGAFLYGLHWSTFSGITQALMYDHLLVDGRYAEYPKHQGAVTAYGYIGAAVANVLSGIITDATDLRMPFLLSIVPSVLGFMLALSLKEVYVSSKKGESRKISQYFTELMRTLKRVPVSWAYVLQIIVGLFVFMTICEFGQVFLLSYNISATTLGLLWALVAGLVALGLRLAHRLQRWPWQTVAVYALILLVFGVTSHPLAILLFMLVYTGTEIMHNIAETELQHVTASHSRATVLSSVTFVGNLLALPLIWLFNSLYLTQSIHFANFCVGTGVVVLLGLTIVVVFRSQSESRLRDST